MRCHYLLYPSAIEKLKLSGIESRIETLKKADKLPCQGCFASQSDIIGSVKYLKEQGFYKDIPKEFSDRYKGVMNQMLKRPEDFYWTVKRSDQEVKEPCELEDMLLFSGDLASIVLDPKEIWDYKKFGFSSPSEFITTVGAFVIKKSGLEDGLYQGYRWITKKGELEFLNEITGDHNADLRVYQTDITPYETKDPFESNIEMRPETEEDRFCMAPYHSTEGNMLVSVLKYIEQQKIPVEFQKDHARDLIAWTHSLGQGGGSCAEHFGGYEQNPMLFFVANEIDIPVLNHLNETNKNTPFGLSTQRNGDYCAYISSEGDLVFSYEEIKPKEDFKKNISVRFCPEEAEHLVKGLLYQSARGLGRTSAKQLIDILEYRYSPEFELDQKRFL